MGVGMSRKRKRAGGRAADGRTGDEGGGGGVHKHTVIFCGGCGCGLRCGCG
jgi:hypothetical protein